MQEQDTQQKRPLCRSVFQNGESTTTTEQVTRMWIELINQLEQGRRI